ncbi:hypothetical protein [Dyadobacter sp. CY312]|uniref:hypothetical protein n=1 Tax=Dyadobacter sp. CY312 TaxID=2907303 RepID=UPI001F35DC8B|nr:hypothetical protein [Dyadobacter sp. CY312]MCE7039209.1 hypothetical protein [Dyadobacter sp. CY312]
MKSFETNFDHQQWQDGARQELIPDAGETVADAAAFMTKHLELFKRKDLTFDKEKIEELDGKFYITLYDSGYDKPARESRYL